MEFETFPVTHTHHEVHELEKHTYTEMQLNTQSD